MDRNKIISTNIKKYIQLKGITQKELAQAIKISPSTLSDYLNHRSNPSHGVIQKMADYFGILKSDIDTTYKDSDDSNINHIYNQLNEPRQRKVYSFAERQLQEQNIDTEYVGQTAAGEPIEGEQAPPIISDEKIVRLIVNGDSMEDLYFDGDIISYKKQPTLENGEIGIFVLNGGVTMKKFRKNGDIRLQSLNDKYEDIIITDKDEFTILGKVIK